MHPTQPLQLARDSAPPDVPAAAREGPAGQASTRTGGPAHDDVVVLLLAAMAPGSRAWGWSRVALGTRPLRRLPGLRFAKALGSGYEGGFGVRPSIDRQGLFAIFEGEAAADAFIDGSAIVDGYRAHAAELMTIKLRATSCRGSWSGTSVSVTAAAPASGPLAALTRASIRLPKAATFWSLAPATQTSLETAQGCRLAVGLGEAPLLRQATFSVWDSVAAMDAYARQGAHMEAIRVAAREGFFSETMFVRFVPLQMRGVWKGVHHG